MATVQDVTTQLIEIYIATFNRAPDADGLAYWLANITDNNWSVDDVAKSMFDSEEVSEKYPTTLSNSAFIDAIYNNVLNRDPDEDGKSYWIEQMSKGISRDEMVITVINGAKADTGSADDQQILENKKIVGEYFAIKNALNNIELAKSSMAVVTVDEATVDLAKDIQDVYVISTDSTKKILQGDDGDDIITALEDGTYIYTFDGDDLITTQDGDNFVVSGDGIDSVYTGKGNDIVYARDDNDTVYTGDGEDTIYGQNGDDSLHGEAGNDIIYGGLGDDYLYGDDDDDLIIANEGNDYLYGGAGDDQLYANDGDDHINTGSGVNIVDGGEGDDLVYGGADIDTIYGGAGADTIYGDDGADILDGLTGNDLIYGGAGDDIVNGNDDDDKLYGGEGIDTLDGEDGNDKIYGGAGADILMGGEDVDTFYIGINESTLSEMDYLKDFTYGEDKLVLINHGEEIISETATDVTSASTLSEAINLASTADGSTNANIEWFIYGDYTYVVEDLSVDATFNTTTDVIIKMQGVVNMLGLDNTTLTFA
jgi:Ca2+-binding RTX toxin-like protein